MTSNKPVLPIVMVSTAIMGASVIPLEAQASLQIKPADNHVLPAVMNQLPPAEYPQPESLVNYTREQTIQLSMAADWDEDPDPTHCASTSGSDKGWDDSDCM